MCVVSLKVFSILSIVYLTIFCYSYHCSVSEIGFSPQWSSSPLIYLHNFHHQSLCCQPDLSQVLRKKISVASRNTAQCHCCALLQHRHGPTVACDQWSCRLAWGQWVLLEYTGIENSTIPVYMPLWHWWGFWGFIGFGLVFFFSVCSWQHLYFFLSHVLSRTMWPTENCRAQFGLFCHQKSQFLPVSSHHVLCENNPVSSTFNQVFPLLSLQGSS